MSRPLKIGLSMRMVRAVGYLEERDALAQDWFNLVDEWNAIPICIPNTFRNIESLINMVDIVILTGGNDISLDSHSKPIKGAQTYAEERDLQEYKIIDICIKNKTPLLGVCRGMQLINYKFGGDLCPVNNGIHVAQDHEITILDNSLLQPRSSVNSYHNYGISKSSVGAGLDILALSSDGFVEAICHEKHLIVGVMWHPERNNPICASDKNLVMDLIKRSRGINND